MELHREKNKLQRAVIALIITAGLTGCGFISLEELGTATFPNKRNMLIDDGEAVWISFSVPPVKEKTEPLLTVQRDGTPVTGDYRWEDDAPSTAGPCTLFFEPVPPLAPGLRYTLNFAGTVKTEDNLSFEKNITVPFFAGSCEPPATLLSAEPADGETAAAGTPLRLRFSKPLTPDTFRRYVSFSPDPEQGCTIAWREENRTAVIRPRQQWEPMTRYRWTVSPKLRDAGGTPVAEEYSGSFRVQQDVTLPRFLSLTPTVLLEDTFYDQADFGLTDAVRMTFSETLDLPTLEAGFSITPDVPGHVEHLLRGDYIFFPESSYTPGEEYVITLSPDITDTAGNRLGARVTRTFSPIEPPQSVLSVESSGLTSTITLFERVHPEPAVPTGPDNLLDFVITFGRPVEPSLRPAVTESITCYAFFPPGGPVNPALETVSWDPGGTVAVLTFTGFERSSADSPGRNQYKLTVRGGGETSLEEDVWVVLEVEAE